MYCRTEHLWIIRRDYSGISSCFVLLRRGKKGFLPPTNYLQHSSESDSRQGLQAMSSIFPAQLCGRNKGSVILIPRSEGWLVSRFREPCSELSCLSPCTT